MLERDLYQKHLKPWLEFRYYGATITRIESLSLPDIFLSNHDNSFFIEMKIGKLKKNNSVDILIDWRPGQWSWIERNHIKTSLCFWFKNQKGQDEIRFYYHAIESPRVDDLGIFYQTVPFRAVK